MREWGWFVIIQKTRPLVGMPNPETKERLLEENELIKVEKKELLATLEKEQGNLSVYHEKQAKCTAQMAGLETDLAAAQEKLTQREAARQDAMQDKKVLEQEVVVIKKDIDDIMVAIQKLEQEKTNRDHTIKSLNDVGLCRTRRSWSRRPS